MARTGMPAVVRLTQNTLDRVLEFKEIDETEKLAWFANIYRIIEIVQA